jgi:diguanylate cyclase (GGDEF)-like protein/PAS domain S-box-containing protein
MAFLIATYRKEMYFIFFIALFISCVNSAFAEVSQNLRLAVVSYRPKEVTVKQWLPLAKELERVLPGHIVELLPLTLAELDKAATEKQLDFILTNPEQYILLKNKLAMRAIATMINLESGHPTTQFAGVIFIRADRADIQTLSDLNGKHIVAPSESSMGAYLMQRWELEKNHVTAKDYNFVGLPQDKTVEDVLAGNSDAGFVRSGVLESLAREGKINLSDIRVLDGHQAVDEEKIYALHSTEHYPEWPFIVLQRVNPDMVRKVSLALLTIQSNSGIAKTAGIAGFNPPADYTPVEVLMLRLHSHPEELKYFNFSDFAWQYRELLIVGATTGLLFFILMVCLIRTNRRFKKVASENQKLLLAVEQCPVSIVITDLNTNIEYANRHFLTITGYQMDEVIGKSPDFLNLSNVDEKLYNDMWTTLKSGKQWRGEIINRHKDGNQYIALTLITPVRQLNESITHYLITKQDITDSKKAEEQIKQLAFYDPLTGLANRRKLFDRLNYSIAISKREHRLFAVFMMDLDKFKAVNDAFGHATGDDLLIKVADRIVQRLRDSDMVARLGGDEFVIVLENLYHPDYAAHVALEIIEALTEPFELSKANSVQIGVSIGISFYPQHGDTPDKLMDHADTALYQAKDNGRGCFAYYQC